MDGPILGDGTNGELNQTREEAQKSAPKEEGARVPSSQLLERLEGLMSSPPVDQQGKVVCLLPCGWGRFGRVAVDPSTRDGPGLLQSLCPPGLGCAE